MTSCDPERSNSWPQCIEPDVSKNGWR